MPPARHTRSYGAWTDEKGKTSPARPGVPPRVDPRRAPPLPPPHRPRLEASPPSGAYRSTWPRSPLHRAWKPACGERRIVQMILAGKSGLVPFAGCRGLEVNAITRRDASAARRRPCGQGRGLQPPRPDADLLPRRKTSESGSTTQSGRVCKKVSEGGLEPKSSRVFPDSALEYIDGGEVPCSGSSCEHASGHTPARVERLAGCGRRAPGAGAIPGMTAARLHSQPGRSRSVTAVGLPSDGCLVALISALGRPLAAAPTYDTVAAAGPESACDIRLIESWG